MKKRSKEDLLNSVESIILELGPMSASAINSTLAERGRLNKSMYTSARSLGCWLRRDSRFEVIGRDRKYKNLWGLRDATKQIQS